MQQDRVHLLVMLGLGVLSISVLLWYLPPFWSEPASQDSSLASDWFSLQLDLVAQTPGFSPPVASRAFAYSGIAFYEAIQQDAPDYQSLAGQLSGLEDVPKPLPAQYHWPAVANTAIAEMTRELFYNASHENAARINQLEREYLERYKQEASGAVIARSVGYGRELAEHIAVWASTDGGHRPDPYPEEYNPPEAKGLWDPTPRRGGDPLPALLPSWGTNRPFVADPDEGCHPGPPPEYSERPGSKFYLEAFEVYAAVKNITPEEWEIAVFWSDDPGKTATPPGHWVSILTQALERGDYSLAFAAEAYARLGIAVADAFIGCWDTKYTYHLVRPITYIHDVIDPDWNDPYVLDPVNTPPFPEYTSGHSVQSGAAAVVLTEMFGEGFSFTDTTHASRGIRPRSYGSFMEAAEEAAISRLYGGIHYRSAIENGVEQGLCIGEKVNALDLRADD